jgi:hypothetical protein
MHPRSNQTQQPKTRLEDQLDVQQSSYGRTLEPVSPQQRSMLVIRG